jgi:mono/diheme cytochrome c family protein
MLAVTVALVGCRQDMHDQPKYEPFEESDFFADGRANRPQVAGTVARGQYEEDSVFYRGLDASGALVTRLPIDVDAETLARGRVVYDVYCSPCHDRTGSGNGMIVRRGFKRPESFHAPRLRQSPPGYIFQVATNGFGEMSGYGTVIAPEERWAVVAYLRALQLSQAVPASALDEADRAALEASPTGTSPPATGSAPAEPAHPSQEGH